MRYRPVESVTTTCSPCKPGDVAVTTTSPTGAFVAASTTLPVSTDAPICAQAPDPASKAAQSSVARTFLQTTICPSPTETPPMWPESGKAAAHAPRAYSDLSIEVCIISVDTRSRDGCPIEARLTARL